MRSVFTRYLYSTHDSHATPSLDTGPILGSPQPKRNSGTHPSIYPSIHPPPHLPSIHLHPLLYPHLSAARPWYEKSVVELTLPLPLPLPLTLTLTLTRPWYEKSVVEKMAMRLLSGAMRCTQRR